MAQITRTDRLILVPLTEDQAAEAFRVYSDTRIWAHRPWAVHTDEEVTRNIIKRTHKSWEDFDLGPWGIYLRERPSEFVGIGGAEVVDGQVWDVKYRLRPDQWGQGYATEIAEAAVKAAKKKHPELPVTARITTNHPASGRVIEKLGLKSVWEGRRVGTEDNPDEPDVRIYSDRELPEPAISMLRDRP
ncbi:GNAT family N-acetyltransferase [Corynebacterium lubricantis]|uniref:GNAT family N-acetyltransferase n=1 Tax=Corynebacterium lubricantis TaxID=541095 RepID=UPI000363C9A8|nr:GNAT family N-acetyltransferase [Corynebacterium lubricantis]